MLHPVSWPNGARCAVMLTFDLDGESPWIHRDPALAERPLHMSYNWLGHPQIVGRPSRVRMLERLIQLVLGKRSVWWPKPIELARFWLARTAMR